jgi:hypothetical protein
MAQWERGRRQGKCLNIGIFVEMIIVLSGFAFLRSQ